LLNERPEYFVFNGSVPAITKLDRLHAKVGETERLFFGVEGPNSTSSFHVIGELFERVYHHRAAVDRDPDSPIPAGNQG
jgi:nitrite reductase (NO-forming)